jgi:hypothetical protein
MTRNIKDETKRDKEEERLFKEAKDTLDNYIHAMFGTHGRNTWLELHRRFGNIIPDPKDKEGRMKPISPKIQKVINTVMVYQNVRLLALATVSSLIDPIGIAVATGDLGLAFSSFKEGIKSVYKEARGDKDLQVSLGEMLGILDTNLTNEALGWEYGGVYMTGWQRNVNEAFFKYTGLQWWTRTTRVMAIHGAIKFLEHHKKHPKKHSARWLHDLGVTPDDIVLDENGNLKLRMNEGEYSTPEDAARDRRIKQAIFRFTDHAILRPTAAQRPIWASDQHFALIFHLKSFIYAFHDRYLRRTLYEMEEGNYQPLLAFTAFVPAMMAAEMLRDLIQHGGTPPRKAGWGFSDYLYNGITRSGTPGLTMIALDAKNDIEYGGWGFESFAGPTIQQLLNPDLGKALPGQNLYRGWLN